MALEIGCANATSARRESFETRPLTSVRFLPPSVDLKSALALAAVAPLPPERKVHPLRRKSQRAAKSTSGLRGSMANELQPVERFGPVRIRSQVFPPSMVL